MAMAEPRPLASQIRDPFPPSRLTLLARLLPPTAMAASPFVLALRRPWLLLPNYTIPTASRRRNETPLSWICARLCNFFFICNPTRVTDRVSTDPGKDDIRFLGSRQENVAGVKLPKFEHYTDGETKNDLTGLARGGKQVQQCCAAYVKAIETLVELASLQTSFLTLDDAIKTTNRRVNALENVMKPKLENTISYIKGELDELEREDFFRLKKVKGFKKKEIEKQVKAAKEFAAEKATEKFSLQKGVSVTATQNMLMTIMQKDDDIIF